MYCNDDSLLPYGYFMRVLIRMAVSGDQFKFKDRRG